MEVIVRSRFVIQLDCFVNVVVKKDLLFVKYKYFENTIIQIRTKIQITLLVLNYFFCFYVNPLQSVLELHPEVVRPVLLDDVILIVLHEHQENRA